MAEYPDDLLGRPAPQAVAQIGLTLLEVTRAALGRLEERSDTEALHDFRVGLRRLRSTFRTFRADVDDIVPKKVRNRLRDLMQETSGARDAEVLVAWIEKEAPELARGKRAGIPWFLAQLAEQRDAAYEKILHDVPARFGRVERRLRKTLAVSAKAGAGAAEGPPLAIRAAGLLAEYAAVLEQELASVRSSRDEEATHAARITAKRLRYLLEPLPLPEARKALTHLKALQNLLGDLHDLHVLAAKLADSVGDAAAARARRQHEIAVNGTAARVAGTRQPRPATTGLLALAQHVRGAEDKAFRRFADEWRGTADVQLWASLAALGAALTTPAPAPAPTPTPAAPAIPPVRRRVRHPRPDQRAVT